MLPIPQRIKSLSIIGNKGKRKIKIRKIPCIADVLEQFCNNFQIQTNIKLEYKGQHMPTLAYKAICALLVTRRRQLPDGIRQELADAQENMCPLCAEKLPEDLSKCEVDHIRRLDQGGKTTRTTCS